MNTIKKGKLGYNLLEKNLLKRGWDIFVPILEDNKIDCIISKNNKLIRLQIKTIQEYKGSKFIPVRKITNNSDTYKIKHYTSKEVDFFAGVDLELEDIYIVPIKIVEKYKNSISIKSLFSFKNNYELLTNTGE